MKDQLIQTANRVARSTIAVVDTMATRGALKGEELSTLGGLRDQCVQLVQMIEQVQSEQAEKAAEEAEKTDETKEKVSK